MTLNDWGRVLVSVIVAAGFIGILILIITIKTQGNAPTEVMLVMLGALGAAFGQVVSYWVGSSSGSAQKDTALQKIAEKTP
jgi:hypothetical protein